MNPLAVSRPLWLLLSVGAVSEARQDATPPATRPAAARAATSAERPETRGRRRLAEEITGLGKVIERLRSYEPADTRPRTLTINGEVTAMSVIEREVIYRVGARQLQWKLLELLVVEQIEKQIEAGADAAGFEVTAQETDARVRASREEWERTHQGQGSFADYLRRTNTSPQELKSTARAELLFDKVFLPGQPKDWPAATVEAIEAAGGEVFWADLLASAGPVAPFWRGFCRQWVTNSLRERAKVRLASDGIPKDAVLLVNGRPLTIEDAKRIILPDARPEDLVRAATEIVLSTALRQELVKRGSWLTDDAFRGRVVLDPRPNHATPTSAILAFRFQGYPTRDAFSQRRRLLASYKSMIAKEIVEAALATHLEKFRNSLFGGVVDVKYIRLPASDTTAGDGSEGAWLKASVAARAAMDAIANGMTFEEAIREFGKYEPDDWEGGVLGAKSLRELRTKLGESEYLDLLNGYSIAKLLLDEARAGQVIGPLRTKDAYVIAKLVARRPAAKVELADPDTWKVVEEDYVATRFGEWAREVAARTKVE